MVGDEAVTPELVDPGPAELRDRKPEGVARQPVPDPPVVRHCEHVALVIVVSGETKQLDPTQRPRDRQPDLRSLVDRRPGRGNLVEHLPGRPLGEAPHEAVAQLLGGKPALRRGEIGIPDVRDDGARVATRHDERHLRGPAQASSRTGFEPDDRAFANRPGGCVHMPTRESLAGE
jgi:hypothetical protein